MEENEEEGLDDENMEEDHWDLQAEIILNISTEKEETARSDPVYRSAEEFLRQSDAKKDDSPPAIHDREERIKMVRNQTLKLWLIKLESNCESE